MVAVIVEYRQFYSRRFRKKGGGCGFIEICGNGEGMIFLKFEL